MDAEYRRHKNKKMVAYIKKRKNSDNLFATKHHIRSFIYNSLLRGSVTKSTKAELILGIDLVTFIQKINNMAIEKYGMPYDSKSMDIDHIVPLQTANTEEEVIKLNHHSNLQPLSKEDHKIKTGQDLNLYHDIV